MATAPRRTASARPRTLSRIPAGGGRTGLTPDSLWLLDCFVVLFPADPLSALLDRAPATARERGSVAGFVPVSRLRPTAALRPGCAAEAERAGRAAEAEPDARAAMDADPADPATA